jgi:transposase
LSTKLHAATDALGNPIRLLAGPGQENDITRAHDLVDGLAPEAVIADRAYDADHLHDAILEVGAEPSRRAGTAAGPALTTRRSTGSATSSSASSTGSSSSGASPPATTSSSPTSSASQSSPPSLSCSDS